MTEKTSVTTIVNVTGGVTALLLVGYTVASYTIFQEEVHGCMASYNNIASFALRGTYGQLMNAIEVQAQAGASERGLMENTQVIEAADMAAGGSAALKVKLGRADATDPLSAVGLDLAWRPLGLGDASAACLRYSVKLGDDFDFDQGGNLPGFFGGTPAAEGDKNSDGFVVRPRWMRDGKGEMLFDSPKVDLPTGRVVRNHYFTFKKGDWVTVESELAFAEPASTKAQLKVWLDGELVLETETLELREENGGGILGVQARVGYLGSARGAPTGEPATLLLSPMEIGWR